MALPRNGNDRGPRATPDRKTTLDFTTRQHDVSDLQPLERTDTCLSEFSSKLKKHLSVLESGHSIALHRGESLASLRLEKNLESLFSTAVPRVIDGPSITWVTLVLSVGPNFGGSSLVKVGDSHVELSADDLDLVRSGRPWRFLSPWPDNEDCRRELRSIEIAQQELINTRRVINEVNEHIVLLEDHLRDRHLEVARMSQDGSLNARQTVNSTWNGSRNSGAGCSSPVIADEVGNHMRSNYPSSLPSASPNPEEMVRGCDTEVVDTVISTGADERNFLHSNNLQVTELHSSEMHASKFIQVLSEVLGDPRNHEAIRWSDDGRSFYLAPEDDFPPQLLARLSTASYGSFIRRLYYFGFRKIAGAYQNPDFIRGKPSSIRPHRGRILSSPRSSNESPRRGPRIKVIKKPKRLT